MYGDLEMLYDIQEKIIDVLCLLFMTCFPYPQILIEDFSKFPYEEW